MSRSPLDALIAAERRSPPLPERGAAKKNWARVRSSVAAGAVAPFDLPPAAVAPTAVVAGAVAPAAVVAGAGKLIVAVVLGAGAVVTAVVVGGGHEEVATVTERRARVADLPVTAEEVRAPTPVANPVSLAVQPERVVIEDVRPPSRPAQAQPAVVPNASAPRATSPRKRRAAPEPPRKAAGIGRELELITRASQAVSRRSYADALAILKECAREFPAGALREDRDALRAIALCESGQPGRGARAAASFSVRFSRSVHTERVREACSLVIE